jgi:citrate lyase subunit beta/citryl-CoA lyase
MAERSWLYVPGHRPDRFAKAVDSGADVVIFDLEDAVPVTEKAAALTHVVEFLTGYHGSPAPWVRVNAERAGVAEAEALVILPAVRGLVVPKATPESVGELRRRHGGVALAPLVESAAAVQRCGELAMAPGVHILAMGEVDLAADLGVSPQAPDAMWWALRSAVVVASAAAGRRGPLAPVSVDFRDVEGFRASTQQLRWAGFSGRQAIHPAQVEVINEVFTPSEAEMRHAHRVVELAEAANGGVCVDDDGRMIDEAVLRSARRILHRRSS